MVWGDYYHLSIWVLEENFSFYFMFCFGNKIFSSAYQPITSPPFRRTASKKSIQKIFAGKTAPFLRQNLYPEEKSEILFIG